MKIRIIIIAIISTGTFVLLKALIEPLLLFDLPFRAPFRFILDGLAELFIATIIVFIFSYLLKDKKLLRNLFVGKSLRLFIWGAVVGLISILAGSLILYLMGSISFTESDFMLTYLLAFFVFFLLAAVTEELFFRGFIQNQFAKTCNKYLAVLFGSVLFTLIHIFNADISFISFFNIFLAGYLLGLMYLYKNNLWLPIGFHALWNISQSFIGFDVSGGGMPSVLTIKYLTNNTLVTGGDFGFEGSVVCTSILILLIFLVYYKTQKRVYA